jgi:hypothetical protein
MNPFHTSPYNQRNEKVTKKKRKENVTVKLSLYLIKYYAMMTRGEKV